MIRSNRDPVPLPGSDAALAKGCTCPIIDNRHGRGMGQDERGRTVCVMSEDCPLHGNGRGGGRT